MDVAISDSGHFQSPGPWKVAVPLEAPKEFSALRAARLALGSIRPDDRAPKSQHSKSGCLSRTVSRPAQPTGAFCSWKCPTPVLPNVVTTSHTGSVTKTLTFCFIHVYSNENSHMWLMDSTPLDQPLPIPWPQYMEKTEVQRGEGICPRSQSKSMVKAKPEPHSSTI